MTPYKVIPCPNLEGSTVDRLLEDGTGTVRSVSQLAAKDECFRLPEKVYVLCTDTSMVYDNGIVFLHTFEIIPLGESYALFGNTDPEEIIRRQKDAAKVRTIAKKLERYPDLIHLVPEIRRFADKLEDFA